MRKPTKQTLYSAARARRIGTSIVAMSAVAVAGCADVAGDAASAESESSEANATAVQIAMTKAGEDFPEGALDSITRDLIIGDASPKIGGTISRALRDGLVGEAGAQEFYAPIKSGGVVRIDAYAMKADVSPFQVNVGGKAVTFPFSASARSRIEFAQVFSTEAEAASAPRPAFWSVPADAQRALALREGTYVTIPLHGEVATSASGTFLSRAANFSKSLAGLLRSSAHGTLSGSAQATLVAKGDFVLEVVRLKGKLVRLRVSSRRNVEGAAGVTVSGAGNAQMLLVPGTALERARSIKGVLEKIPATAGTVENLDDKLRSLRQGAAPALQSLLASATTVAADNPLVKELLGDVPVDDAVALASGEKLTSLEQRAQRAVDATLAFADRKLTAKLAPVDAAVRRYTDHTLDVGAAVALSGHPE